MQEIVLPDDVKPALEWVNGRVLQKMIPRPKHALAQGAFAGALIAWARACGTGMAGTEMRFQVQPPGEVARSLVPDVAFVSYDRVPREALERDEAPRAAPDVVVEIRSPSDRKRDVDEKLRVYLAAGTTVIFLVDPENRSINVVDRQGVRDLSAGPIKHEALPGFSLEPALLFELPRRRL